MGQNASDKDLLDKLQEARQRRMHFAFVAKGTNDGALILDQRTIPQATIMIAKARSGGTTVVHGDFFEEDGRMVFETTTKPPDSLATALAAVIHRATGLTLAPLCRAGAGRTSSGQIAYVGSEPGPVDEAGYANLAPDGSPEASESNMAPNLTDTDAYVNRLVDQAQAIETAKPAPRDPPPRECSR